MKNLLFTVLLLKGCVAFGQKDTTLQNNDSTMAEFPGGKQEMMKFIAENTIYPIIAIELGLQGKCYLQFRVSEIGDISGITVVKGVPDCPECDREAKRVIQIMPRWKPSLKNGIPYTSYFSLPITFKFTTVEEPPKKRRRNN